jgi:hypothetical protein
MTNSIQMSSCSLFIMHYIIGLYTILCCQRLKIYNVEDTSILRIYSALCMLCFQFVVLSAFVLHSVTIKFPNWYHKNNTNWFKNVVNIITKYSSCPLPHDIYIAHTTNRMPVKTLPPVSHSVLLWQYVGSIEQPRISSLSSQLLTYKLRKLTGVKSEE